jgi:enoyl-CoA hydratase/carnithine racemase
MTDAVSYQVANGVAWLTIERPEARNALNLAVRTGLYAGVRHFNDDDTAKVLVLTGAGEKAFCAGGDLKEMAADALTVPPPDFVPQFGRNVDVAKPTIAAVNGVAWAGGFLLAQCCDLCIAADTATFAISEVKVGRGAPWAAPLSWLIPPRIALQVDWPLSHAAGGIPAAPAQAASLTATRRAGQNRPGAGGYPGAGLWAGSCGTTAMTRFRPCGRVARQRAGSRRRSLVVRPGRPGMTGTAS